MEKIIKQLLAAIGENPGRRGLVKTPSRVTRAYEFLTQGYVQDPREILESAIYKEECNHMIIVRDIEVYSLCEHHLLPFFGRCHIGYIARDKVYGVSKLARLVDCFARRLQVQERLTQQIAASLEKPIEAEGVGVVIEAQHLCMMMRGVQKQNSEPDRDAPRIAPHIFSAAINPPTRYASRSSRHSALKRRVRGLRRPNVLPACPRLFKGKRFSTPRP
jgi:GTP cyclohydrolase I